MIVQLTKQRPHRRFTANEVARDGSIVKRRKTLAVELPKHSVGVAEVGSVWNILEEPQNITYEINGFKVHEDLIQSSNPEFVRPSGELLACWITHNIKGVGEVKARRLIRAFPNLDEKVRSLDLEALSGVSGVSLECARQIVDNWPSQAFYAAIQWLQESGLPIHLADRLARIYGDEVLDRLRIDPFILTAFGVSFEDVLRLVEKLDIKISDESLLAAIAEKVALSYGHKTGSTVVPEALLTKAAKGICDQLKVPLKKLAQSALKKGSIVRVDAGFQLLGSAIQEASVAKFFNACAARKAGEGSILAGWECQLTDQAIERGLNAFETDLPFTMTHEQRAAIIGVVKANVAMISGGAGTGKTTILQAVLSLYESVSNGMAIMLVALSGRAAQRMAEATGREAITIAKLIANHAGDNKPGLPEHLLLVVDEASMVDLLSAYRLIGLLPYSARIILVGDVAQIPPVGPGLVFHCVMQSGLPVFELTQVKRQGQYSGIHQLATGIRNAEYDEALLAPANHDVFYAADASDAAIMEAYRDGGGPESAIVLTPTRRGPLGVKAVNALIQSSFDEDEPLILRYQDSVYGWIKWVTASNSILRLGDKVIVTANDYEEDIRNGDIGTIIAVYSENQNGCYGSVEIEGIKIEINQAVLDKLELGYAITIHKSQGSQWPTCLFLMPEYSKHMLDQTLLYTAVTRPLQKLVILGDKSLIESAIERGSSVCERTTNLLQRLKVD